MTITAGRLFGNGFAASLLFLIMLAQRAPDWTLMPTWAVVFLLLGIEARLTRSATRPEGTG